MYSSPGTSFVGFSGELVEHSIAALCFSKSTDMNSSAAVIEGWRRLHPILDGCLCRAACLLA